MLEGRWKLSRTRLPLVMGMLVIMLGATLVLYGPFTEDARAVRPINVTFNFEPSNEAQRNERDGNVIDLWTGPQAYLADKSTIPGQSNISGYVSIYRSAKFERTAVFLRMWTECEHPELTHSIDKPIWEFRPGFKYEAIAVKVFVRISPFTRYSTGPNDLIKVTVKGEWLMKYQAGGSRSTGAIPDYPIYINVRPFHQLRFETDPPMLSVLSGGKGTLKCSVFNQGNGYERVEIDIPTMHALTKGGWVIEMEETVLDIGPGERAYTTIKITSPRTFQAKLHGETIIIPVHLNSYFSKYNVQDNDYLMEFVYDQEGLLVQITGVDFVYIPYMWAIVFWILLAVFFFNFGVNPLTLRKRKLPPGKDPGFIALYHFANKPERRERWKRRRMERKERRKVLKSQYDAEKQEFKRKQEQEKKRFQETRMKELPTPAPAKHAPPRREPAVLDLKRQDDDFDIEIPNLNKPGKKEAMKTAPLLSFGGGKKKPKDVEKEMLDVLSHLDD
ncbi:MAG: hypothetical protein ACMUIE_02770 [Thermoplasmatota archaeon]